MGNYRFPLTQKYHAQICVEKRTLLRRFVCVRSVNRRRSTNTVSFLAHFRIYPLGRLNFKNQHLRTCLTFEFRKASTATAAFKSTCAVYTDARKARTCQLRIERFKNGDCDITDRKTTHSERPSFKGLLRWIKSPEIWRKKHNVSCLTVHEHLRRIRNTF